MRASRLLSIFILLQLRGRVTAHALADEFEVSIRTIYRDVDELSAAGVPVFANRGSGGGFQLLDGYRTRLTGLTASEAETLLLAGLPGPAADLGLSEALGAARLKLLAALPPKLGDNAARIGSRLHVDMVNWYGRAARPSHLKAIAQAVWDERRVAVRYESWSAIVSRTVDPLGLVTKGGSWYLVGRTNGNIRTYKISKVLDLDLLGETFEYPTDFDLARHWRSELARFEESLRRGQATLRVSSAALSRIDRLGADAVEAIMAAPEDAQGTREVTIAIEGVGHAASLLLGFASDIEVISPAELRDELIRRARLVMALYSAGDLARKPVATTAKRRQSRTTLRRCLPS